MAVERKTEKSSAKYGTVVRPCAKNCKHDYQDRVYSGRRLHNLAAKGMKARCTVCGEVVSL